jgi:hypothetical protein
MKLKRNTVLFFACLLSTSLLPTSAFALESESMSLTAIATQPWFIGVAIVAALAVIAAICLAISITKSRRSSCNNSTCSYHPLYLKSGNHYDFSAMETPEELTETSNDSASQLEFKRTMLKPAVSMTFTDDMVLQVLSALDQEGEGQESLRRVS